MSFQCRRAAFADRGGFLTPFGQFALNDVVPVTEGVPPVTHASTPGFTFQVRPTVENCNPSIPETPYESGLLVALVDGSVLTIRPGVAESVFWAMVTPAGGEVVQID